MESLHFFEAGVHFFSDKTTDSDLKVQEPIPEEVVAPVIEALAKDWVFLLAALRFHESRVEVSLRNLNQSTLPMSFLYRKLQSR